MSIAGPPTTGPQHGHGHAGELLRSKLEALRGEAIVTVRGRGLLNAIVVRPPAADGPDALDLCHALMHAGLLAKPTRGKHGHTKRRASLAAAHATAHRSGGSCACSGLHSLGPRGLRVPPLPLGCRREAAAACMCLPPRGPISSPISHLAADLAARFRCRFH